jgi:antitoxin component of RelBE/YafQ-DinJ toxin-antitoxin module
MKGVDTKKELVKSSVIIFRVNDREKAEIQKTAKSLGMTTTEYFTRLHAIAKSRL